MFADNLKQLRKEKGLTQTQFASEFNIATGTIAMWETGKRTPDTETLKKIARYFNDRVYCYLNGTSLSEIYGIPYYYA